MSRIARVTQKIFAGSAVNNGQFGSAAAGSGVTSASIATIMGLAAWASGWLSAVLGSSKFPPLEEFQGVEYVHSTQIAYILQQGIPEYDSGTNYFTNNIVMNPGTYQVYGSLTDNNIGNALASATNWKLLVDLSTVGAGNPSYAGGTSTGSGNAQVLASVSPSGFTLTNGYTVTFTAGFTNTGGTTLNVSSTGVTTVKKNSGAGLAALTGGEIVAGNTVSVTYNAAGTCYVITNSGGLLASNNLSDVQSTSTALSNIGGVPTTRTVTAAGLVTGGGDLSANRTVTVTAASAADQRTGISNTVAVTPGVQKYHPSSCKAWVSFTGSSGAVLASYNVTSVTHNSTGDYTVNFTNAMTDGNYAPSVGAGGGSSVNSCGSVKNGTTPGTGSFEFVVTNVTASPIQIDETYVYATVMGNQ